MGITLIVAVAQNGVIGRDDTIPWKLPNDLKHFKELTVGKTVVMGRKTWESLPDNFKPLPNRENWVMTLGGNRSWKEPASGVTIFTNLISVLEAAKDKELMVIGGSQIYSQFLMFADKVELTLVHADIKGDRYFRNFLHNNWKVGWEITNKRDFVVDEKHAYPYSFITYERIRKGEF